MKIRKVGIMALARTFLMAAFLSLSLFIGQTFAASDVMTLSLSSWTGPGEPAVPAWNEMAKDLEEATQGKIKVKIYHGQALGKAKEHYELALKGIADMAYLNVGFTPGRFPITDMASYAHAPSAKVLTTGLLDLMKEGYLDKEYEKVKLLYVWTGGPNNLLWTKGAKPAVTLSEFKGKKIRVPTTAASDLMRALEASPVAIPMPEVYTAMERGVVDGTFTTPETMDLFRLSHVCNEITRLDSLTFAFCLIMNKDKWDQLPEPAKAVLQKNAEKYGLMAGMTHDKNDEIAINTHKPKIYELDANELKRIKALMAPSFKEYVEKYESAGYKAKEAANAFYKDLQSKFDVEPYVLPD